MSDTARSFDPVWENSVYGQGRHLNRYPFDIVVSFVHRNYPRTKPRAQVRILEVGCGAGNNLWFAAREGFQVAGIDGSATAIAHAQKRFAEEGLTGDLRCGDFVQLPFETESFDLAIDRAAITCCGHAAAGKAVSEVRRVLRDGGRFFFNPYSDKHSSAASGRRGPDGLTLDIAGGTLVGVGQICFYGRRDLEVLFQRGWRLLSVQHCEWSEESSSGYPVHGEWRVVAEKTA
jgi:SAM-dependent methyltransferase